MVTSNELWKQATVLREALLCDRRRLHQEPEVGDDLPRTRAYIAERLTEMGYEPKESAGGIVACIGTEKVSNGCVLLRADMDALAVREKTDLPFASTNGCMHACGHDMHAAMLLGAAALLKHFEKELCGCVKLVFQPNEENFGGAKAMIAAGVTEAPKPFGALALHVHSGTPSGLVLCGKDTFMAGCSVFRITVKGVGCHGAMPETGVDPLYVAAQIYLAMQSLVTREVSPKTPLCLTVGKFGGGEAPNVIPETACIEGTIRSFDKKFSERTCERLFELARSIADAFRAEALCEIVSSAPPLYNHPAMLEHMKKCATELFSENAVIEVAEGGMGSEDFAAYTEKLPCAYLLLGAGSTREDPLYGKPMHNESVIFNEDILPNGAALYAYGAMCLLADHNKNQDNRGKTQWND